MLAGDRAALSRGIKRPADPYAFDDDPSPGITMDGLKQEPDEAAGVPKVKADSLFTTEGLQPKPDDLDNLFDDRSDGDEGAVPTPPGSNKPNGAGGGGGADDAASGVGPGGKLPGKTVLPTTAVLTSIELSKIYPTPPSHEHNHNPSASPVCHYDGAPGEADLSALAVFKSERGDDRHPPQSQDRTVSIRPTGCGWPGKTWSRSRIFRKYRLLMITQFLSRYRSPACVMSVLLWASC